MVSNDGLFPEVGEEGQVNGMERAPRWSVQTDSISLLCPVMKSGFGLPLPLLLSCRLFLPTQVCLVNVAAMVIIARGWIPSWWNGVTLAFCLESRGAQKWF